MQTTVSVGHQMRLLLLTVVFSVLASASPLLGRRAQGRGYQIRVESEAMYCSFLPPSPGNDVAGTEKEGVPFCTDTSIAPGSSPFPSGFIRSAHFEEGPDYVQVTGTIDRSKYNLKSTDGGGQYDNKDLPGSSCVGYPFWVNLIEPDSQTFCIRCCHQRANCNTGISTAGCKHIVPGNYN